MKKGVSSIVMNSSLAIMSSSHLVSYPTSASESPFWAKKLVEVENIKNCQIAEKDRQIEELTLRNKSCDRDMAKLMEELNSIRADGYDMRTRKINNKKGFRSTNVIGVSSMYDFSNENRDSNAHNGIIEGLLAENDRLREENDMLWRMNEKTNNSKFESRNRNFLLDEDFPSLNSLKQKGTLE
jgi:cell division protein FtsB